MFEGKLRIVEAREHALLLQERDVAAKEEELIRREEALRDKERDYDLLCADMEADCWRFRREFRFLHKVVVCLCCIPYLILLRIVVLMAGPWMQTLMMLGTTRLQT